MQYLSNPKDLTCRYFIVYRGLCTYQFVWFSASFTGDFNTKKKNPKKQISKSKTNPQKQIPNIMLLGHLVVDLQFWLQLLREMLIMHVISQHQYLVMLSKWYSLFKQAPQDIWLILHWIQSLYLTVYKVIKDVCLYMLERFFYCDTQLLYVLVQHS